MAVAGVHGGVGATAVAASLLAVLGDRLGAPAGAIDRVGGGLLGRLRGTTAVAPAPPSAPSVADVGPHALGDADVLARAADVIVIVAPLRSESARAGDAARRAIVERRSDDGSAAVLVLVDGRPTGRRTARRARAFAASTPRTIVLDWDPVLADRRVVRSAELSDAMRAALGELCDALGF